MEQQTPTLFAQRLKTTLVITAIVVGAWFIFSIRGILSPFVIAFVLAYVMTPLVDRMEGRGLNRTWSIIFIFVLTLTLLALGVITAGKKLADEIVDLSVEFLRPESVERRIDIINDSTVTIPLSLKWEEPSWGANPFAIIEPGEFPAQVDPGDSLALVVRFAPSVTSNAFGHIRLYNTNTREHEFVRFRGNVPASDSESKFWREDIDKSLELSGLTLRARGIDFGNAGPNVITRISTRAKDLEPLIQPYLSAEADIASQVKKYGGELTATLLGRTTDLLEGVASGLTLVVIVPFVAFFFLREGRRINHAMIELVPNAYFELFLNVIHQINGQIGGYIRGQLLAVSVVAGLSWLGLSIIGMPYALPVGVLAGLANMIPYLGPLIGIVSASAVALATQQGMDMVWQVMILFVIIQILDNILIQPLVVAKSVDLHPLIVLIVVMIGSDIMGIVGMLIAVPVTGIVKVSMATIYDGVKGFRAL